MKSLRMTNSLSVFVSGVSLMRLAEELKQHDWLALSDSWTKCCVSYLSGKFCNIGQSTCFSDLFYFFRSYTGEDASLCLKETSGQELYLQKITYKSRQAAGQGLKANFFLRMFKKPTFRV